MNLIRRSGAPLSAYRPGSVEDQFGRIVDTIFEEFFAPLAQAGGRLGEDGAMTPRLNVHETDTAYEVQAELPGVAKEDVRVTIEGDRVQIEANCQAANERREGETVVYAERTARRYLRSFALPMEVDDAAAQARLENGVLQLTLPKKQGGEARRLTIN